MRPRMSGKKWGLQGSGSTGPFISYPKRGYGFKRAGHFPLGSCSIRAVLTILALLALSSCPSLAQQSFGSTSSKMGLTNEAPTQGECAVMLAERLELGKDLTQQQAIFTLTRRGIEPLGGWQPDARADDTFVTDIRNSATLAAKRGAISAKQLSGVLSTVLRARSAEQTMEQTVGQPVVDVNASQDQVEVEPIEERLSAIEQLLSGEFSDVVPKRLTQFGYDVFQRPVSTFAPVTNVPVGPDYIVGPGDNFTVTLWGRINAQYTVTVSRSGEIAMPEVGVLKVWGMTFGGLEDYLEHEFSRKYTDFKMAVIMGRLRTIQVYVVGEARTPGSYTLSSLSTVINAIFAGGGPSKNGTLRKIRLLKNEGEPVIIDLYDFLLGGDKSEDVRLQNGDTIFIPLIGSVVGVAGNVKRPAIYEMSEPMTLAEVLDLAGGVTYAGWLQRVQVERTQEHEKRIVVDFDMSSEIRGANPKQSLETIIQDGDVIKVFPVLPLEQNVVYLEGHVYRPGKYELKPGMRLRDVLNSYEVLRTQPNLEYAEIVRLIEPDYHPIIVPFNVGKLLEGDVSENVELARFDTVRVFRWDERVKQSVSISGFVFRPGEYRLIPDMKVSDLINAASGLMKNAYLKTAELTRRHISQVGMQTEKIDIDLEKALSGVAEHNIALQDYDHLIVRSVPELEFDRVATIFGEVKFPGTYPIHRGETLSSVIERAGGYTERAYLRGAVFTRESAKIIQQQRMDELTIQLEESVLTGTDRAISGALDRETIETQQMAFPAKRELLGRLKAAKITGRVIVRLTGLDDFKGSKYDLELEKGDELIIPETPGVVNVVGEVFNSSAILYEKGRTVSFYLRRVGGLTKKADKKQISIIRVDGSVISSAQKNPGKTSWDSQSHRWIFGGFMSIKLSPGDTIVAPRKIDKLAWLRPTKEIMEILFQIALTAGIVLAL